ncbi:hypothetical protein EI42_04654 [Thermosporothrix hazakensis]|jgi:biotin operon repressor|uniref:HTH arsR-type domain-containing protein n=2 Tax=Thermosporothrix TaxID=768650 RepID=A0A326U125_THEHA|nr:DUF2087 domain-containing protein [Thermosporothrix hazakensis]PZW24208.1 hypothetical protein EI42_04654 [Thermosporothrix hazakensis]BBH89653.1 hypothetical protein KTC_44040 [Thermosporothrix sp. COM3]GCE47839.1 hypothetical protein KTH_27080 [Thermosporothrix hazakensis]
MPSTELLVKTLTDVERLKILGLLAIRPHTLSELAEQLQMKENVIAHHLARLSASGLTRTQDSTYVLNTETLNTLKATFQAPSGPDAFADFACEEWERVILRNFFDGHHLKEIPASFKKLKVVLRWLAERFEPNIRYAEREVNERLKLYHPDFAYLRRCLVDFGLMQRENGIYWRQSK